MPGATSYRAEVGISPYQMLAGYELGANVTSFALQAPQGIYYLRVFARNAQGISAPVQCGRDHGQFDAGPAGAADGVCGVVGRDHGEPLGGTAGRPADRAGAGRRHRPGADASRRAAAPGAQRDPRKRAAGHLLRPGPRPRTGRPERSLQRGGDRGGPGGLSGALVAGRDRHGDGVDGGRLVDAGRRRRRLTSWRRRERPAARRWSASRWPPPPPASPIPACPRAPTTCGSRPSIRAAPRRPRPTPWSRSPGRSAADRARTPNPPSPTPPNYLPLPNREAVVREMARLYPGELRASCGNNTWLFRLVHRLRQEDTRWGLNWKRSRVGDMSQDAITYNYGPEADEGTRFVHVVDVIGGHCGSQSRRRVDRPDGPVVDRRHLDAAAIPRRRLPAVEPRFAAGSPGAPAVPSSARFSARNFHAVVHCSGLAGRLPARSARIPPVCRWSLRSHSRTGELGLGERRMSYVRSVAVCLAIAG